MKPGIGINEPKLTELREKLFRVVVGLFDRSLEHGTKLGILISHNNDYAIQAVDALRKRFFDIPDDMFAYLVMTVDRNEFVESHFKETLADYLGLRQERPCTRNLVVIAGPGDDGPPPPPDPSEVN